MQAIDDKGTIVLNERQFFLQMVSLYERIISITKKNYRLLKAETSPRKAQELLVIYEEIINLADGISNIIDSEILDKS